VDIDWSKAPVGAGQGAVTISGGINSPFTVKLTAYKATPEQARAAQECFGGLVGPISFLAAEATANIPVDGVRWEKFPDYGRVSAAMEVFPVTADTIQPPNPAPTLEYPVYFARAGTYDVNVYTSPTLDVIPTRALALAVSMDDQPAQVVNVFSPANYKSEDFLGRAFNENTRNNDRVLHFKQTVSTPGKHTLKIIMIDPTVVVEKIIIHDAPTPKSYFGPPETVWHGSN
jgi:Gylcosyl hydrolase family 115 C-terminal domain